MKTPKTLAACVAAMLMAVPASAHHSYAMFDGKKRLTVRGTVAKVEWQNPHVFLWLHVPKSGGGGHDLYAFESDSINALVRHGWTRSSLKPGETVTVDFFALRDGRNGGHFIRAVRVDGTTLSGAPGPVRGLGSGNLPAHMP